MTLPLIVSCLSWILIPRCGDIHANPGPKREFNLLYTNVRGLNMNINDLRATATKYDLVLCSETIVSSFRHTSELLLPEFNKPLLIRRNAIPRARGMCAYVRSGFTASRQRDAECSCHEVMVVRVCSRHSNVYIYSCYRNPDLDDSIYDCLKESMSNIQESDRKACFVFVGDFNAHHRDWLQSRSATDRHGVSAYNFANETGCTQLVAEPTHISGNTLDLFMTDVPGICRISVSPQIGTSDHFSVSAKLNLHSPIPEVISSRRVHLMSRVNWEAVEREVSSIHWREIIDHDSPADSFNDIVGRIISRFVPMKMIKFRNKDRPWFTAECRAAFHRKQTAFRRWTRRRTRELWDSYKLARNQATIIFNRAEESYNIQLKEKLSNSRNSHSWWRNLKHSLFGSDQATTPLRRSDGSLTFDSTEKARILADHFNSKMSRDSISIPSGCIPEPKLNSIAFKSFEIQKILENLDEHGSVDPNGLFPSFFKRFSGIFAPKLALLFRKLIRVGDFPSCWKIASVTPIPKEGNSCKAKDYRPISITPVLSKVFERLLARRLNRYIEAENILPKTQFGYRKGLGTVDALLTLNADVQAALNDGMEVRAVAIDFSAAFDKVNHDGIIHNLQNIGVGGKFLSLCRSFLLGRHQYVTVDGCRSPTHDVPSGVPQGSVLGPLFFILYTASMFSGLSCMNIA